MSSTTQPRQQKATTPVTHRKGALQAAAKVASSASKKTGRPVSPRVKALLEDRKAS